MAATITLTILDGKLQGKSFTYDSRTICWVGRQDNCNIQFPAIADYEKVSRLHCLIDIDPPKISIRDFNSLQGTYVDSVLIGRRNSGAVAPATINANIKPVDKNLESGNIITLGDVHLKVTIKGEQPDYNPPPIPKPPNLMRVVADKAIEFIKIAWGVPANNSSSKSDFNAIGGYKIVKEIGAGGYGKVFLAENAKKEQIAIKVMLAEVAATPAKVKMFEREIDNAKALNHPNVTRLVDNGFDPQNNCLYYAMEYCAGENLNVFMHKMGGILPLDLSKRLIFQILDGLEYTHNAEIPYVRLVNGTFGKGKGLVHRDLKPANIMLATTTLGQIAKVGDFGLAKAFDCAGLSGNTKSGDGFRGTPHFMCRKQVLEFQRAKPEVDIWAAAACLYYMLTAKYPRHINSGEGWDVLFERNVIPILDRNPDLPAPLSAVIDRALAEDSQNKEALYYQTVGDFKADLTTAFAAISL